MTRQVALAALKLALLLMLAAIVAACGGAAEPSVSMVADTPTPAAVAATPTAVPEEKPTIGLVMKTLTNPFFVEMERGARRAESELGVELIVRTGAQETSVEQQIAIVRDMIAQDVDAIVIAPADSTELIPVLKQAQDAGIVIVNIDNQLNPDVSDEQGLTGVPFISVNNEKGAYSSAKFIADQVTTPTQAVILEGIRTAQNAEDRKNGALRAFAENSNIVIVAMETANWKIDEGYDVSKKLLEQYPDVKLIFAANDMMAFGAIRYLQEAQRSDVLVAAYDALEEAKMALAEGTLAATVDQQAALQGYMGVDTAVRALNGETLPVLTLVDTELITKADLEQ
jgi:ribose transport system substrate-binding protein